MLTNITSQDFDRLKGRICELIHEKTNAIVQFTKPKNAPPRNLTKGQSLRKLTLEKLSRYSLKSIFMNRSEISNAILLPSLLTSHTFEEV